jgi:hypothetical protein
MASVDLARGTKVREFVPMLYPSHAMLHVALPTACRPARSDRSRQDLHEGSSASGVMRPDLAWWTVTAPHRDLHNIDEGVRAV